MNQSLQRMWNAKFCNTKAQKCSEVEREREGGGLSHHIFSADKFVQLLSPNNDPIKILVKQLVFKTMRFPFFLKAVWLQKFNFHNKNWIKRLFFCSHFL